MQSQQIQQSARKMYTVLLMIISLTSLETIFVFSQYLAVKSEQANRVLWGYSGARLVIISILLLTLLACLGLIVLLIRFKERAWNKIAMFLQQEQLQQRVIWGLLINFVPLLLLVSFDPASFSHYQAYFEQIRLLFGWAALLIGQLLVFAVYLYQLTFLMLTRRQIILIAFSVLLVAVWFFLRRDMVGRPSTSWMSYYHAVDFVHATPGEILTFFKEMRSGIPPLLSFLEILNVKATGSTEIITNELYRLALLVSYLLALWLFSEKLLDGIASFLLALVFLPATALISSQNPEIYDVYFPSFLLLFFLFDQLARKSQRYSVLAVFLSGLFLAFAELSRPFVLIFIPIILLYVFLAYRPLPRKYLLAFLTPFLLLSGGWHTKLLIFNKGQVFWSNHGGFNFYRAWGDIIDMPELVDEPQTWDNRVQIHTQEHYENSKRIQTAVVDYIVSNPLESFPRIVNRIVTFLRPRITLFDEPEPQNLSAWTYRIAFYAVVLFFLIQVARLVIGFVSNPSLNLFADPQHMLLVLIGGFILILALAEKGEEARLLLAVLPLLTSLPRFRAVNGDKGSKARSD